MSEKVPNRREVSAEYYERTDRYRAMEYLQRAGFFERLDSIDIYHGRAGDGSGNWRIDPAFDNSDNNTGHRNINKKPAISTGTVDVARKFANARAYGDNLPELHRIISSDPDAVVIDASADMSDLEGQSRNYVKSALAETLPGVLEAAPLDFYDRYTINHLELKDFGNKYGLIFDDEIDATSQRLRLDTSVVEHVGSAINTRKLIGNGYLNYVCEAYLYNKQSINFNFDGEEHFVSISAEYFKNWARKNHVVGYKTKANSATLGEVITNYLLFDLEKVQDSNVVERVNRMRDERFGQIALSANKNNSKRGELARALSDNLYIKPEEIIKLAKKDPLYKKIFESDAGNWEGFTLEEHTETVLRLFDDNFADFLPASTLPIMRMALLVHDIGKPLAVMNNDKKNQKQYNLHLAEKFLAENDVDEPTAKLIKAMIGEGMMWAERYMIRRADESAMEGYLEFCERTLGEYMGTDKVSRETLDGFGNMLAVLQTCDSAAYTTMAVTRSANGVRYRNYGSLNDSFEDFRGLTGRRARIKPRP